MTSPGQFIDELINPHLTPEQRSLALYLKVLRRFQYHNWLRYEESRLPIRNEHCRLLCICRYAASLKAKPVKTANSLSPCCATIQQHRTKEKWGSLKFFTLLLMKFNSLRLCETFVGNGKPAFRTLVLRHRLVHRIAEDIFR